MNEEQKSLSRQYTSSFSTREVLRLGCAIMKWLFLGIGLSIVFELMGYSWGFIVFVTFFLAMFVFAFTAYSRKLGYSFLRKIIGNEHLPTKPYPKSRINVAHEPRPLWVYLFGIWHWLMLLLIIFIILKWYWK